MQPSIILAIAGLTAALPALESSASTARAPAPLASAAKIPPGDKLNLTHINPDDAHKRILEKWNPEHIIQSDDLLKYFEANRNANYTIYLNDTRTLIDLSSIKLVPAKEGDNKRDIPDTCVRYKDHWAEQVQSWYDSWNPASSCLWTGNSQGTAAQTMGWSYSKSIETNSGLDFKIIKDVLGISAGFSVTETWTKSGSWTCNIPANSVGQIWISNKIVWGWMWERTCQRCRFAGVRCWGSTAKGGAKAPVEGTANGQSVQYGCSTGRDKVRC